MCRPICVFVYVRYLSARIRAACALVFSLLHSSLMLLYHKYSEIAVSIR